MGGAAQRVESVGIFASPSLALTDPYLMKDIDYSRPLDVHRYSDYPEVNEWVDAFWDVHLEPYFPDRPIKRGPSISSPVVGW